MAFSLTQALLASAPSAFSQATQSAFLSRAAQGQVPKSILGTWLANDRLYIHAYIRAIGRQLSLLALPVSVPPAPSAPPLDSVSGQVAPKPTPNERLLKWLIDALVNIHREEAFFVDTARRYGIEINLPADDAGRVPATAKLEGLVRFEALFDGLAPLQQQQHAGDHRQATGAGEGTRLPWLEFAVVLWGTEKCYLEAWTGAARAQQQQQQQEEHRSQAGSSEAQDLDGGALRREFIPNWTSREFVEFVDVLGEILDDAVREEMRRGGEGAASEILERAMVKWRELLDAERTFWPAMT